MECVVCVTPYNDVRKPVACVRCNYTCCKKCVSTYLLQSVNEPHCMNCRTHFNREFLMNAMSNSWVNTKLRPWREKVMLEQQIAMIPTTMNYIERMQKQTALHDDISAIDREIEAIDNEYRSRINKLYRKKRIIVRNLSSLDYELEYVANQSQPDELRRNMRVPIDMIANSETESKSDTELIPHQFYGRCAIETCDGFVNRSWNCIKCNEKTCAKCHAHVAKKDDEDAVEDQLRQELTSISIEDEEVDEIVAKSGHKCDPNDVETVRMINKTSRSCPSCFIPIHRIDGCDQMWCVQCHTAFSYRTGEIINEGVIHNPHYVDWLNNGPRENLNIGGCGQDLEYGLILEIATNRYKDNNFKTSAMTSIYRFMQHVHATIVNVVRDNLISLRREKYHPGKRSLYILGKIDETYFRKFLTRVHKQIALNEEKYELYNLFYQGIEAILQTWVATDNGTVESVFDQLEHLVDYVNSHVDRILEIYENQLLKFTLNRNNARAILSQYICKPTKNR